MWLLAAVLGIIWPHPGHPMDEPAAMVATGPQTGVCNNVLFCYVTSPVMLPSQGVSAPVPAPKPVIVPLKKRDHGPTHRYHSSGRQKQKTCHHLHR